MRISVVIPVFNEAAVVARLYASVAATGPADDRLPTLLSNIFTNLNLSDMETWYKVFTKQALEGIRIRENRFGFEPEIVAKVARPWVILKYGLSMRGPG